MLSSPFKVRELPTVRAVSQDFVGALLKYFTNDPLLSDLEFLHQVGEWKDLS